VRSDVAIPRCASPERDAPDAFGALQAPARESGGVFLPTARPDGPFNHDRHHRTGGLPLGGAPPGGRLSILDRPPAAMPTPPRGRAGIFGLADGARLITGSVQPPIGRKASLIENDPAFHLDDLANRRDSPQVLDTGRPALGRAATALGSWPFRRHPDEQGGTIEAGSDAFAY
jgi:hypothetical protein